MGRDMHSLMLSIQQFFYDPGVAHPPGALKDGSGEAVMTCDMPKLCRFPSLGSCQKGFLWTHNEVEIALHLIVGLVLQAGHMEKFPQALGFESLDPFLRVSKQGP